MNADSDDNCGEFISEIVASGDVSCGFEPHYLQLFWLQHYRFFCILWIKLRSLTFSWSQMSQLINRQVRSIMHRMTLEMWRRCGHDNRSPLKHGPF